MKTFLMGLILSILVGCYPEDFLTPKPTGLEDKDFALQAWIEDSNLTYCVREKNLEQQTDGYICSETHTDKTYYVPIWAWEQDVQFEFVLYAKSQSTELLENMEYFCEKVPGACRPPEKPTHIKALEQWEVQ